MVYTVKLRRGVEEKWIPKVAQFSIFHVKEEGDCYPPGMYSEKRFGQMAWDEVEVVGNIYENPELLKTEVQKE